MSMRQHASGYNADIKSALKTPAPTTPCKARLSTWTMQQQQRMIDLTSKIQNSQQDTEHLELPTKPKHSTNKDEESAPSTQSSLSFQFPDHITDILINSSSAWPTWRMLDKYTKRLEICIDTTKSYFEAKFNQERDEYAEKLAKFDNKFKTHVANMNQKIESFMQQNVERAVQNKIKEKLVNFYLQITWSSSQSDHHHNHK